MKAAAENQLGARQMLNGSGAGGNKETLDKLMPPVDEDCAGRGYVRKEHSDYRRCA